MPTTSPPTDKYGRPLEGLRVSVNNECNYKCVFCHMEGVAYSQGIMSPRHYVLVAKAFKELGGREVKVTGGEPLLRQDLDKIILAFTDFGLKTSLTTNGHLLEKWASRLASTGLDHINVSIHALDEGLFREITGGGDLNRVVRGIEAALKEGIPVKINYVALRKNLSQFPRVLRFAEELGLGINVIQVMPIFHQAGNGRPTIRMDLAKWRMLDTAIDSIETYLRTRARDHYIKKPHSRKVYITKNGVNVTLIRGYNNPLACYNCTRIRITPDAKVKTCLYAEEHSADLMPFLEKQDISGVKRTIVRALLSRKPRFPPSLQNVLHAKDRGISPT